MEHTQGKLVLRVDGRPELDNQNEILETEDGQKMVVYFRFNNREDARRLVACWNACEGISTETLELVPRFTEAGVKTVQSVEAEVAALKAQRDELLAGLAWLEQFNPRDGEGANERFERIADAFYKDTGHLRPGKDASMACGISEEDRIAIWQKWLDDGRSAASALIAKHKEVSHG